MKAATRQRTSSLFIDDLKSGPAFFPIIEELSTSAKLDFGLVT
jgi:hypothetical protein